MAAMVALALTIPLNAFEVVHLAGFSGLADDIVSGVAGEAEATAFDERSAQIAALYLIINIAAAIAYLAWLSRAVANVPALGGGTPIRSPRGAIGWWFVPIASWFVPFQIVTDLHDRLATGTDADRARPLLLSWWLLWVVGNVSVIATTIVGDQTVDQLKAGVTIAMAGDVLLVISAILAIVVVQRIQRREDARAAGAGSLVTPVQPASA
jgi:hypothetical protein